MRKLKSSLILLFLLPLSITILGTGCEKDEPEEEQVFSTEFPGFAIYKTNGDYFDLVDVGMQDDIIVRQPTFAYGNTVDLYDNIVSYSKRQKLENNYILGISAVLSTDVFLDISIAEYYQWEIENDTYCMPVDSLYNHILDQNPYSEFWKLKENLDIKELTKSEINELIKNNKLSLYFNKLK